MIRAFLLISQIICFIFSITVLEAQSLTQIIKGKVLDKDTQVPLIGVTVILLNTEPLKGAVTNLKGNFEIKDVFLGRYDVKVSYLGYETITINQILVSSGKEVVLNIVLREDITSLKFITVVASQQDKNGAINDMSTVSVKKFSTEETGRYAGSFNDPARAVQSFAGVSFSADNSNEIVIRGNSSKGLLWRLEGIEIPNPNHFTSGNGSAGGGVSILNGTVLANSDFFTGAFPAEYGNALSGVFDLNLRKGNNTKREYTAQIGFLGVQFLTEGPFSKKSEASYLVNYRYSTLGLLNKFNLQLVDDQTIIPEYQDISFNIHIPTKNAGNFSIFGIGGFNNANTKAIQDSSRWIHFSDKQQTRNFGGVGIYGFSHTYLVNKKTYVKTVLSYAIEHNGFANDSLDSFYEPHVFFEDKYTNNTTRISALVNHKFNTKHILRSGIIYNNLDYTSKIKGINFQNNRSFNTYEYINTHLIQSYLQWKFRVTRRLEINTGVHHVSFVINNNHILEPRFGLKWVFKDKHVLSFGTGLHSKTEPSSIYMSDSLGINPVAEFIFEDGNSFLFSPKISLRLTQSVHTVLGYNWHFAPDFHLKTEIYYQELFNVPVENKSDSYLSIINFNTFDMVFSNITLVNKGRGYNYGLELTLEKFFSKSYYFLVTASLFESKYRTLDGTLRNTRFNKNYVYNILGGKEFKFGKTKENIIDFNIKMIWTGGNRIISIDLEQSQIQNKPVFRSIFEDKNPDYFRLDVKVGYRLNKQKYTLIAWLDIQNVINRRNVENRFYNIEKRRIDTILSLGIIPVLNFKIEF